MKRLKLDQVTLLGVDCVDSERLFKAFAVCESYADFAKKKLITKTSSDYTTESGIEVINKNGINSLDDYSFFMVKELNNYVDSSFVLTVQYDGFILNPAAWTNDFLKYDYVGAPWWYNDEFNVGNGGFSLRSKRLLKLLQEDKNIKEYSPEDHCICRVYGEYLKKKGIRFAPEKLAKKFSIEGALRPPPMPVKYGSVWNGEFGFHGLDKTDISQWTGLREFLRK